MSTKEALKVVSDLRDIALQLRQPMADQSWTRRLVEADAIEKVIDKIILGCDYKKGEVNHEEAKIYQGLNR